MAALSSGNTASTQEIIIERRYREFYAFALAVYSMFPSKDLWQRLPPKTLCFLKSSKNDGFLLRRKNGLDDFIRCAIEMMDLGSSAQGTIGQWYLVRKFLNLPSTMLTQPTKDRSLVAAMYELKKHARQTQGWNLASCLEEHDAIYEKTCDGFQMMKRVRQCPFPARAVFDMIVKNNQGNVTAPVSSAIQPTESIEYGSNGNSFATAASRSSNLVASWNPLVEHEEILRRDDGHTWVERTTFKGGWVSPSMQMTSIKSWKVEDNGTIIVIMIPADDGVYDNQGNRVLHDSSRVDCIMGGWMITPTPKDETCTVTWLTQANFGECDPQSEFTGSQGLSALISRSVLLSWADEIVYLLSALERSYSPSYYRHLGPLLSGGDFQKLKLKRRDTTGSCVNGDPRVYTLARELEPCLCLLIHKSTNKNVLIFKTNLR
uniref:PX domain-containing protein n=1 Tax=Globisporangium ultimum (strain ATCC 200006 / CBS 805.95 / DAOM BR144) TaxID=431595 RepID=K3WZ02_GLOUD